MFVKVIDHNMRVQFFGGTQCSYHYYTVQQITSVFKPFRVLELKPITHLKVFF